MPINQNGLLPSRDVASNGDTNSNFFLKKTDPLVVDNLIATNVTCDTLDLNGGLLTTTNGGTVLELNGVPVGTGGVVDSITGVAPVTITGTPEDPIISIANSGVTAGTFNYATVSVNSQGLVTSASSGVIPANDDWSNFPAQSNVNIANFVLNNVGTPLIATDGATKGYVDGLDGNNVKLTGDQTIAGIKTFSSVPICATMPTTNNQLANKQYVDMAVGADTLTNVLIAGNSAGANQINMNNNKIVSCADPTLAQDVATKNYVDTRPAENLTNTLIAGNSAGANQINMNSNKIVSCADPTQPQDVATKNYVDNAIPGIPTLSQVLTAGNTASADINMNDFDISSVNDITMSGLAPTITATNVLGNLTLSALGTFNALTGGQMTLASGGIMSIGGATYTTLENMKINNSAITKDGTGVNDLTFDNVQYVANDTKMITIKSDNTSANTSTKATFDTTSGSAITIEAKNTTTNTTANVTLNSVAKTAKLSAQDPSNYIISEFSCDAELPAINTSMSLIRANAGVVRRIEMGIDSGLDYTKIMGLTAPPTSLSKVITYDPTTDYIYQQDLPAPSITGVLGKYSVQEEAPATSNNDLRTYYNDGIDAPYQINPLYDDADSNIPFFNKDGTPFPNLSVSVGSVPWSSIFPKTPNNSLQIRSIQTNPYSGLVYVGAYDGGSETSMIYTFNPSLNQWSQIVFVNGELNVLLYDEIDDRLYYGGYFNNSQVTPGVNVLTRNIGYYSVSGIAEPQSGLNNKVYCMVRWNNYIAIGGSFSQDNATANQLECFALYSPLLNDFFHIGQGQTTTPSQYGFNDAVMCLAVLPQTNILVVGGIFGEQFYNGTSTSFHFATAYTLLVGFNQISDGSLGGDVNKMLVDYEGKRLYLWGTFTTSVSGADYFTALPINNLEAPFIPMPGYPFGGANFYSAITKDEIGGYIWLFNNNEGQIWRYNPVNNSDKAFEYMNTILGIADDYSYGYYSWYDKAIHFGIVADYGYYRTFCDQRVKIKVSGSETITYNGNSYNTIVLPKKGSSVSIKGDTGTQLWNVLSYTNGVYFEWDTAQIKQIEPAYATILFTGTLTGIGSPKTIEWTSSKGRNISITGVASSKIQVQQKGLYKMSYSVQLDNTAGGTIQAYIWFIVNGMKYQNTNTLFVVNGPNDETAPFVDVYVELDIGDWVGLVVDSPSGTLSIPSQVATATRPAIPGIIFNIQMVQPSTQFFYPQ